MSTQGGAAGGGDGFTFISILFKNRKSRANNKRLPDFIRLS